MKERKTMSKKRLYDLTSRDEIREFIIKHPIRLYFEGKLLIDLWEEAKEESGCVIDSIKDIGMYIVAMVWIFMRILFYPVYKAWTVYSLREKMKKSRVKKELDRKEGKN
jgi:hypothetical protein